MEMMVLMPAEREEAAEQVIISGQAESEVTAEHLAAVEGEAAEGIALEERAVTVHGEKFGCIHGKFYLSFYRGSSDAFYRCLNPVYPYICPHPALDSEAFPHKRAWPHIEYVLQSY